MLSKLDLDPKCQGHSRNQELMNQENKKHATPKKFEQGVTPTPTAVKQYVDPTLWGGRHNDVGRQLFIFYFFENNTY